MYNKVLLPRSGTTEADNPGSRVVHIRWQTEELINNRHNWGESGRRMVESRSGESIARNQGWWRTQTGRRVGTA